MNAYLIFSLMVLTHVLCDFYFQSDKCVEDKKYDGYRPLSKLKRFLIAHLLHAFYHSVAIAGVVFSWIFLDSGIKKCDAITCVNALNALEVAGIVLVSHFLIDVLKECISYKYKNYKASLFVVDQILHLGIIFWVATGFFYAAPYQQISSNIYNELITGVVFIVALLVLIKPASFFITLFISSKTIGGSPGEIKMTKSVLASAYYADLSKIYLDTDDNSLNNLGVTLEKSKTKAESVISYLAAQDLNVDSKKAFLSNDAGKWIGYIERSMIFIFFIFNQAAAIAVIMAIKTAFRFNDLKDDNDSTRSEYIMIGTFLSFFITMIIAGIADFSIKSIWDGVEYKMLDFNIMAFFSKYIL